MPKSEPLIITVYVWNAIKKCAQIVEKHSNINAHGQIENALSVVYYKYVMNSAQGIKRVIIKL